MGIGRHQHPNLHLNRMQERVRHPSGRFGFRSKVALRMEEAYSIASYYQPRSLDAHEPDHVAARSVLRRDTDSSRHQIVLTVQGDGIHTLDVSASPRPKPTLLEGLPPSARESCF